MLFRAVRRTSEISRGKPTSRSLSTEARFFSPIEAVIEVLVEATIVRIFARTTIMGATAIGDMTIGGILGAGPTVTGPTINMDTGNCIAIRGR